MEPSPGSKGDVGRGTEDDFHTMFTDITQHFDDDKDFQNVVTDWPTFLGSRVLCRRKYLQNW